MDCIKIMNQLQDVFQAVEQEESQLPQIVVIGAQVCFYKISFESP